MTDDNQKEEFKGIVDTWYTGVYRFAYSLSKSEHSASDLTQQTFYLLAKNLQKINDKSKVKSWLFTTVYREFIRANKKSKRMTTTEDDTIFEMQKEDTKVYSEANRNIVIESIEKMDENFRAPLTLFYIKDYTYKEIAETLDIPIGTVMSRISRAKDQLQGILSEMEEELR